MGNGQGRQVAPAAAAAPATHSKDDSYASPPKRSAEVVAAPMTHTGAMPSAAAFESGRVEQAEVPSRSAAEETPQRSSAGAAAGAGASPRPRKPGVSSSAPPNRALPAEPAAVAAAHKAAGRGGGGGGRRSRRADDLRVAQEALEAYSSEGANYVLRKLIGKGAYGAVYLAEDVEGARVAVKYIVNGFTSATDARRIFREIKVMQHFQHPNIVELKGVILPRDREEFTGMYIVSELMETDLHRVIHSRQDLTSDHISYFVYQLLCALQHLHAASVLHRDLKPSNLLVNADCSLKICDFGLARETDVTLSVALTEYVVTRWYRAPEVLLSGGRYTAAIDVWSVGCILGELLLRRPLFPGENYLHQLQLIMQTLGSPSLEELHFVQTDAARQFILRQPYHTGVPFAQMLPHVRGPCLDLLHRMLLFDPSQRITIAEALEHPFLARVRAARAHISETPPPAPFTIAPRLRKMSVPAIRAHFVADLCLRAPIAGGADEDSAGEDGEADVVRGAGQGYYNGEDGNIDQDASAAYWTRAGDSLTAAEAATAPQGAPDPAALAAALAALAAASGAAGFHSVPGGGAGGAPFHAHARAGDSDSDDGGLGGAGELSSPLDGPRAEFLAAATPPPNRPLPALPPAKR